MAAEIYRFPIAAIAAAGVPDNPQAAFRPAVSVSEIVEAQVRGSLPSMAVDPNAKPLEVRGVMSAPARVLATQQGAAVELHIRLDNGAVMRAICPASSFRLTSNVGPGSELVLRGLVGPTPGPMLTSSVSAPPKIIDLQRSRYRSTATRDRFTGQWVARSIQTPKC